MFSIERSGYYAWLNRKPGKRHKANQALDQKIISVFNAHRGRYGYPRMMDELQQPVKYAVKTVLHEECSALNYKLREERNSRQQQIHPTLYQFLLTCLIEILMPLRLTKSGWATSPMFGQMKVGYI